MAISLSKKKPKSPKKVGEQKQCCSSVTVVMRLLYKVPIAISLLLLIYLWSSSTAIISGKIVHVCVSSRKLNSLYCLSAGTQPNFEIPIPLDENNSTEISSDVANVEMKNEIPAPTVDSGTISSPLVNLNLDKETPSSVVGENTTITPIVTLDLGKEISSPIVDNSTMFSPNNTIVNEEVKKSLSIDNSTVDSLFVNKEARKEFQIPFSIVEINSTDSSIINEKVKKEIPNPIVDNSTISSTIVNEEVKKEISSPIVANSTISSTIVNEEVKKEIPSPIVDNITISSSIVNEEMTKEIPSPIVDNSTVASTIANLEVKKEIPSPIVNNSTISSTVDNSEVRKEESVLQIEKVESDPAIQDSINHGGEGNASINAVDVIKEQIHVLRSWTSNKRREGCEGRGIYVYDLPSKFNKDLIGQCSDMISIDCKHLSNEGLGQPIPKLGKAWYHTHQYSLELISHSRALKHPCRVYNESEAKLFYVPFYGGMDVLRWHFKNVSNDVKDILGLELIKWLERQPPWKRNSGKDHVFVLGKITWDFRRSEKLTWGTRFLEIEQMQNPAKILIERHAWRENDIGVPHPTFFHPNTDDDIMTWQAKIISSDRRNLVGFAGAARPNDPKSIRSILIDQCTSAEDHKCKFLNCFGKGCSQPESVVELFVESEFCLQPPGDSATRKSVFDSLVSGCIPVLFDPFTAYYQYPWHLPEDHGKYSVFIDQEEVRQREVNVVERLMKVSKKERDDMRRFIVYELLPGLVYGHPNSKLEQFQDAFSITINSLLERVNNLVSS